MNINPATSRRPTQLPPEAFARPAGLYGQLPIPRLVRIAAILCALLLAWNAQGLCANSGPAPTYLDRPDYNYAGVTCMSCHFGDADDHTSRAAGVQFGNSGCMGSGTPLPCCTGVGTGTCPNQWERTGHGWWDSRHSQSENGWSSTAIYYGWTQPPGPYGENDNTFCANCHSPLQASVFPIASISESGTTATVTFSAPGVPVTDIGVGDIIFITGTATAATPPVACTGYNNTETSLPPPAIGGWTVTYVQPPPLGSDFTAQIQFTAATSSLATCYGGTLGDTTRTSGVTYNGSVLDPVTVLSTATGTIAASAVGFTGVWCSACHSSTSLDTAICARYPAGEFSCATSTLIRGANPALAASWIPILPGQESQFCLTCHEQDPHNAPSNSVFQVMYAAGVSCIDCHMAPYLNGVVDSLLERFHDWKVAENLPYSCGAQGSLPGYTCHSGFTAASALAYIPFMTGQHSDWWSLPPFSTETAAISAHELNGTSDQLALWREIQAVYGPANVKEASYKETSYEEGARLKTAVVRP